MHARNMRFYVYLSLILESVKKKDANRALTYQPARYLKTLLNQSTNANNFLDGVHSNSKTPMIGLHYRTSVFSGYN